MLERRKKLLVAVQDVAEVMLPEISTEGEASLLLRPLGALSRWLDLIGPVPGRDILCWTCVAEGFGLL